MLALSLMTAAQLASALDGATTRPDTRSDWQYRHAAEGDSFRRPSLRAVPLSTEVPEGVRVEAPFTGAWQRYGHLRYGDADSTRVAVALDHLGPRRVALFVDADRDLVLESSDRVAEFAEGRFQLALEAWADDGEAGMQRIPRSVEFELGRTGSILGVATLGFAEGEVVLGERHVRARWRDGDANGLFADEQDQLWLDLDGDGAFAPLRELFLVQPILTLDGARFRCRADRLGRTVTLDAVVGAGLVTVAPPPGVAADAVVEAKVVLVGRDGTSVVAVTPGEPVEVPVGEYRVTTVTLRLADPGGQDPYSYVFTDDRGDAHATWRAVENGATLQIDPIGALSFDVAAGRAEGLTPGAYNAVQPTLRTADGLHVVTCYRGREATGAYGPGAMGAEVTLQDAAGEVLAEGRSGFA